MRTTTHNGRTASNGKAFNVKHNDRNGFEAEHIDPDKTPQNWTWTCYKNAPTFDECEQHYYRKHFGDALDARNARYGAQRHPERVQTIDQYRSNPRNCPEETITQIGKHGETVDPALLKRICIDQISWEQERFPNVRYLDLAMHVDEPDSAPHLHGRKVWIGHDKDGNEVISQNKALAEMGIDRPDPAKPQNRYNNPKQTYTRECREHFQQLCRDRGLVIETEPRDPGKSGLSLLELKARTAEDSARQAEQEAQEASQRAQRARETAQATVSKAEEALDRIQASVHDLEAQRGKLLKAGEIDLSDYKQPMFRQDAYIVPADDLRDLVRTVDEHRSIDDHARQERQRIRDLETAKLRELAQERDNALRQAEQAQQQAQQAQTALRSLQEFVKRAVERSPLVRQWKQLWDRSREFLNARGGVNIDGFSRAENELRRFEKQSGLLPERQRNRDRGKDDYEPSR